MLSVRYALPDTPLILNPLVSLADTIVADRRQFAATSLPARALRALDRRAFAAADVVVADTYAHAELFGDLGARRVEVCAVGAEERIFHPPWKADNPPHALFVGKLIPLHGVDVILDAARAIPDRRVVVVGDGQLARALTGRPQNVEWRRWVPYELLGGEYRRAGCALGIFASSPKASRVIPNKAYQALACATPLVTADTPASRELLEHGKSALLVPPGDAGALAAAIDVLLADQGQRARLSSGGHAAFRANAADEILAVRWREIVAGAVC